MVESKVITAAMVRRVMKARSHRWATRTVSLFQKGMIQLGRQFYLVPKGRKVEILRGESGKNLRPLRPTELGMVEGMWRRGLKEMATHLGIAPRAAALAVDRKAAGELVVLVGGSRAKIERAIDDPGEYTARRFARPLIDVLTSAGVAAELDWRSEPDELTRALAKLARKARFPRALTTAFVSPRIDRALRELARAMTKGGWALVRLELQSDSHGFFVVRGARLARVKSLLRSLEVRTVA